MKKTILLFFLCTAFLTNCTTDDKDLEKENEQLKQELAAEKGKTVIEVRVEGEQMVLVYSTGDTETLPLSDALEGVDGKDGVDGVGIESITYDDVTGVLTITLTNGNVTTFSLLETIDGWVATYLEDLNGKLFVTEAMLGSVPVIKAEYNDNYQLTYLENNIVSEMAVAKAWDVSKQYENGKLTASVQNTYALEDKVAYTEEYFYQEWEEVEFTEDKGEEFKVDNGNETFTGYGFRNDYSGLFEYRVFENCVLKSPNDYYQYNSDDQNIIRKVNDKVFEYYNAVYRFTNSSNEEEVWYQLRHRVTITGGFQKGDLESTKVVKVETNSDGSIVKAFEKVAVDVEPHEYMAYEYNKIGKVIKSQSYYKSEEGLWESTGIFNTYIYDADNNLTSTIRTNAEGVTEEVQRATYDENGNPTELWKYEEAVFDYRYELNPETGVHGYQPFLIREAGLYQVGTIEYDYKFKNFLGNSISALLPELENYRIVNAIKSIKASNSYSFANIKYDQFDEYGYPHRMSMNGSGGSAHDKEYESVYYELILSYLIKGK